MADRKKKEGKTELQKFEYLKKEKSFLDERKTIFLNCIRAIVCEK